MKKARPTTCKEHANLGHTHEMLKKDTEVTKRYGWRNAIAFSKPQTYNFSAHEKTQFSGKANSVVVTF